MTYFVLDAGFEVSQESRGLVPLHLPVLDSFPLQMFVHLDGEDGSCTALILGTGIP